MSTPLSIRPHLLEDYQDLGNKFVDIMDRHQRRIINISQLYVMLEELLVEYKNRIEPDELERTRPTAQPS
jgi:hypothetical protein